MTVNRSEAIVEEIASLLPDIAELEVLRLRLVSLAVPDPGRTWDSSSAFATSDKRVLRAEQVDSALDDAEAALHQYVSATYAALRPVLQAFWGERKEEVARLLVEMGEQQEEEGRWTKARRCYQVALSVALPLGDKTPQILALRRIGRVAQAIGELGEGFAYYDRSAELARDSDDVLSEVIARTGMGNIRMWQGRLLDAYGYYSRALALADGHADLPEMRLARAQLFNNLASVATRLEHHDEAEAWFDRALAEWEQVSSSSDLAICYSNLAHLREAQGRREEARDLYVKALHLPVSSGLHAGLATDLAEWHAQEGRTTQAEEWSRTAEEHAIAARSPYILGRMYQGRGNVARARGDDDGFIFYEKALEIAREKKYAILEAETLVDYAQLRVNTGGAEEAQAYLERALEVFRESGSVREQARAEQLLTQLASPPLVSTAD